MPHSNISIGLSAVSLRDLALLQAVFNEGSFNRAARRMHISPSGLSHQIQKIENALGAPLFERGGRHVMPTAAGRQLLPRVDAILMAAEDLEQTARSGGLAFGGELRLGLLATLGPYLLPHLVAPFPQHFTGTRLSISEGKPRGLLRRLSEGELDAVLAPPAPPPAGVQRRILFFEPYEILLHRSHALAGTPSIRLDALHAEEATLMAESLGGEGADPGTDAGHVQDVSLESLAALIALRGGYGLVPALAHERLGSIPDITLAAVDGDVPGRHIALYWRQASPWGDDLAEFGRLLCELAGRIDGLRPEDG